MILCMWISSKGKAFLLSQSRSVIAWGWVSQGEGLIAEGHKKTFHGLRGHILTLSWGESVRFSRIEENKEVLKNKFVYGA